MSWRERYLQASWRGVPFMVRAHSLDGGERLAKHLYAQRKGQFAEGIGSKPEDFSITAFVLGKDYDKDRDALLAALRKTGMGELIHPYLGIHRLKCETWNLSETFDQGGVATFTLNFVQSDEEDIYPSGDDDSKSKTESESNTLAESSKQDFLSTFDVTAYPSFIAESAAAQVEKAADAIGKATSFFFGQSDAITDLAVKISDLKNNALDLVRTPETLAENITSSIGLLNKAASTKGASFSLFDFGEDIEDHDLTTPARIAQRANKNAMNRLIQCCAISSACQEAINQSFETHLDAINYRNKILDGIDDICERGVNDAVYNSLCALRTSVSIALQESSVNLPVITTYFVKRNTSTLVLSQRIYGSADMADDIEMRNKLEYPGFVRGGSTITILQNNG